MVLQPPALEPLDPSAIYYATFRFEALTDDLSTAIGIERRIPEDVPDRSGLERFAAFTWRLRWERSTFLMQHEKSWPDWPYREIGLEEADELVGRLYDKWLERWEPPPVLEPLDPDATYYAVFTQDVPFEGTDSASGMMRRFFQDDHLPRGFPRYAVFTARLHWEHTTFFIDEEEGRGSSCPYKEISFEEAEELVRRLYDRRLESWPPFSGY